MAYYGYDPMQRQNYAAQAVGNISGILGSLVAKYPELKQVETDTKNNVKNNQAVQSQMMAMFSDKTKVPDAVFADANISREQFISTLKGADTKKNTLEFANDIMKYAEPLYKALDTHQEELDLGQAKDLVSLMKTGYTEPMLEKKRTDASVMPERYQQVDVMSPDAEKMRTESRMKYAESIQPELLASGEQKTKEELVPRIPAAEAEIKPRAPMTAARLEETPEWKYTQSEADKLKAQQESRLQQMTDYQAERIKIAWANLRMRDIGQKIDLTKEAGKFKKDMHDAFIAAAKVKYDQLPPLYDNYGTPTGATWSSEQQADYEAFSKSYINKAIDMGNIPGELLMSAYPGQPIRRTGQGSYTEKPVPPGSATPAQGTSQKFGF